MRCVARSYSVCSKRADGHSRGTRLTFAMLNRRIGRLTNALASLGVRHGSIVAILDWDSYRYPEGYFGIPMMGATMPGRYQSLALCIQTVVKSKSKPCDGQLNRWPSS
ncbi:AMP-binding protein [Paraburkholderia sediminicola]|uniref:AMP-binding protein n=2 Tax=Paraburkholderia sediminicola TaxID=458836 RepID=UPI0038B8318B